MENEKKWESYLAELSCTVNGDKAIEGNSWSVVSEGSLAILISPYFTIYRLYRFNIFPFSVLGRISSRVSS